MRPISLKRYLPVLLLLTGGSPAALAGCGDSTGPACDGRPCATSADCCGGLVCRRPSEGILPVGQERRCRNPAPAKTYAPLVAPSEGAARVERCAPWPVGCMRLLASANERSYPIERMTNEAPAVPDH